MRMTEDEVLSIQVRLSRGEVTLGSVIATARDAALEEAAVAFLAKRDELRKRPRHQHRMAGLEEAAAIARALKSRPAQEPTFVSRCTCPDWPCAECGEARAAVEMASEDNGLLTKKRKVDRPACGFRRCEVLSDGAEAHHEECPYFGVETKP